MAARDRWETGIPVTAVGFRANRAIQVENRLMAEPDKVDREDPVDKKKQDLLNRI